MQFISLFITSKYPVSTALNHLKSTIFQALQNLFFIIPLKFSINYKFLVHGKKATESSGILQA